MENKIFKNKENSRDGIRGLDSVVTKHINTVDGACQHGLKYELEKKI